MGGAARAVNPDVIVLCHGFFALGAEAGACTAADEGPAGGDLGAKALEQGLAGMRAIRVSR